jgi:hypothetical protein
VPKKKGVKTTHLGLRRLQDLLQQLVFFDGFVLSEGLSERHGD